MNLTEGDGVDPKRSRIAKRSRSGVSRRKAGGPRRHDRQATASILCYCAFGTTTLMEHKACRLVPGLDGVRFPGQMEMSQWGRSFFSLLRLAFANWNFTSVTGLSPRSVHIFDGVVQLKETFSCGILHLCPFDGSESRKM